jgi:hypothetical protein
VSADRVKHRPRFAATHACCPVLRIQQEQERNQASFHLGQREFPSVRLNGRILGVIELAFGKVWNLVIDIVRKSQCAQINPEVPRRAFRQKRFFTEPKGQALFDLGNREVLPTLICSRVLLMLEEAQGQRWNFLFDVVLNSGRVDGSVVVGGRLN